jgi:hypothetical protein
MVVSLKQFIVSDIEDHACALLPQFLADADLLRLASVSKETTSYRYYIKNLFVRPCDVSREKKARFLDMYRQKCLQSITVTDASSIPLVLKWLITSGATELTLAPSTRPSPQVTLEIDAAILAGTFRDLRVLRISNIDLSGVVDHLTGRVCPELRTISFDTCHFDKPVALGVCVVRCKRVTEWSFSHCTTPSRGMYSLVSTVAIALRLTRVCASVNFVGIRTNMWDTYWLSQLRRLGSMTRIHLK